MSQQQADIMNQNLFREYVTLNSNDIPPLSSEKKSSKSESKPNIMLMRGGYFSSTPNLSKSSILGSKPSNRTTLTATDKRSEPSNQLQVSGVGVSGTSWSRPASGDVTSKLQASSMPSKSLPRPQLSRAETARSRPASQLHNYTVKSMSNIISRSATAVEKDAATPKVYTQRKIHLKPPVELPAWNLSTKPKEPFPNPKNPETSLTALSNLEEDIKNDNHDILSAEKTSSETLHENVDKYTFFMDENLQFKRDYHANPFQVEICSSILPNYGDTEVLERKTNHFITQVYAIATEKLDRFNVEKCINKIVSEYPILSLSALRNTKIIDDDIKFYQDTTPFDEIQPGKYFQYHAIQFNEASTPMSQVSMIADTWASQQKISQSAFGVLLIDARNGPYNQFVVFGGSRAVLDELSLTWLSRKTLRLLFTNLWHSYESEEVISFEDLSFQTLRTRSDISFWRDQCIEVSQDNINIEERSQFEKKLKNLQKDVVNLKSSLASSSKRKVELEMQLKQLRLERMAIDAHKNDKPVYITDPTTGNTIEMTKAAKMALMKTVLGEEAIGENITPFLNKHDVSPEIQRKINASNMTLEEFATLTAAAVECLNFTTKDKRQLMALADYVRNRIKECVQEQGKVKFTLERLISKTARTLEAALEDYNSTIKKIDMNEDMAFRLKNILHPPFVEKVLKPINLNTNEETETTPDDNIHSNKWGFLDFMINNDTIDNLHKFRDEWTNSIRNKRKKSHSTSQNTEDSDNDSLLEFSDEDNSVILEKKLQEHSVGAVCLAAFGVLLRHITGSEIFLIGVKTSFRVKGSIIGPLSDTMPVKIDLSKKGQSFSGLFSSLYRIFKNIKRHGPSCPSAYLSKMFKLNLTFPVQFHFVSKREYNEWIKLGLTDNDLLKPQEIGDDKQNGLMDRLWSQSSEDDYNIKFIMIEKETTILCGVRYLTSKFDEERVTRWIAKFQSTLEGIDCSRRKLSVTSMITRFYNPIWKSNSSISASSKNSLRASSMYLFSSNDLLSL